MGALNFWRNACAGAGFGLIDGRFLVKWTGFCRMFVQEVLASKSPNIYDPKPTTQRPFHDDYPQGTGRPAGSRITVDIGGRPIADEAITAGRRVGGGVDEGLSGIDTHWVADALGLSLRQVTRSGPDLRGDVGRYIGGPDKRI